MPEPLIQPNTNSSECVCGGDSSGYHEPRCPLGTPANMTGNTGDLRLQKRVRLAALDVQIARLRAERSAVEDGTMGYIEEVRSGITADGLARTAAITTQAANNRLRRLERVGVLARDALVIPGGGRLYAYTLVEADDV